MTSGALVLVATPIGNIGDLSPRAAEALRTADAVCCEDTRRTGRLFEHAGIERAAPFIVINDHTEAGRIGDVLARIRPGERVAIVTDAGTPGISDPGERLVRAATDDGLPVEIVPGPSAAIAGLVASGLPAGRFVFEGFLPRRGGGRSQRLAALATERRTIVLYEAPHRLAKTLADLEEVCGGTRTVAIARELTKLHEEIWRGTLAAAGAWAADTSPRGELVIVVDGAPEPDEVDDGEIVAALQAALARGVSTRDAAAEVAKTLDVPKRRVYALATGVSQASPQRAR